MEIHINKNVTENEQRSDRRANIAGFTLVESVIAIAIISIGLVGTAAAIATALKFTRTSRNITEAKAIALAQIEQIHSLRDSHRLNFRQINDVSAVDNTGASVPFDGFANGFYRVSNAPGTDGIFGTPDDPAVGPGPDSVYGTADDTAKADFTRRTVITNPVTNLKKIVVTVRFSGSGGTSSEITAIGYLNNDLKQN